MSREPYSKVKGLPYYKRIHSIWLNMKARCNNPNRPKYPRYGGRGIKICNEWLESYENFRDWAMANGYRDDLSIDRIDVNGNYEPNNCRWTDMKTQQRNRRNNHLVTFNNETKCITEWAEILGCTTSKIEKEVKKC